MKTFSLALRNLLRNRRRSITTLLAMVVGLSATLLFGGYCYNIIYGLQSNYVQHSGHLQLQRTGYFLYGTGNPASYGIRDYQRIIEAIKKEPVLSPMLQMTTSKLQLGGIAGNFSAGVSRTVAATGVVVEEERKMMQWNDYDFKKPLLHPALEGTKEDAAIIGTGVARVLQLCGQLKVPNCVSAPTKPKKETGADAPSDITALSALEKPDTATPNETHIEVLAANDHGAPNVINLHVVTVDNVGIKELDDVFLKMHLSQAQRLIFGNSPPQVTAILVQLKHSSQMSEAKARLQHLIDKDFPDADLEIQEFTTLNPMYGQSITFFKSIFGFIATLIGVIVLFTIGNTMSTAVVERTVEIGTLRSMGLRRNGIRRLFMTEGILMGAIGVVAGLSTALLLAYLINNSGLSWTPPGYVTSFPIRIRVWGQTEMLSASAIGLMIVSVISAWWPASRASRLNIVDALRHV
ncbi:ABC transporter permease [Herbaspirillum sp. HC18]|nr:ABC transporter permease [Herbaspirillum sp. HC18]